MLEYYPASPGRARPPRKVCFSTVIPQDVVQTTSWKLNCNPVDPYTGWPESPASVLANSETSHAFVVQPQLREFSFPKITWYERDRFDDRIFARRRLIARRKFLGIQKWMKQLGGNDFIRTSRSGSVMMIRFFFLFFYHVWHHSRVRKEKKFDRI